ncbi:hypothetical protein PHMEG_00029635, partial [Phytophthora megakarya]
GSAESPRSPTPTSASDDGVSEDSQPSDTTPPPPETSVEGSRSPTPAPTLDGGAFEDPRPQGSLLAPSEPEAPSARAPSPTPTPAPAVDSATRGVSVEGNALPSGSVESRGGTTELSLSLRYLAKLVVGVVRQPPLRVDSHLDRRLNSPSTVSEAVVAPHQLPPHEAEGLTELREEVSRLQTRCENAETSAEADLVRANEDFYSVHDSNQVLRAENEDLVGCVRDQDIAVAEQAHAIQGLKDRCRSSEADCVAAMRYVDQERERMKAGLVLYNAELSKLRQYLDEHSRGKVSSPSPRTKTLLAENASLRRANSVLRRNSAEHGLNTDVVVLSTAGISASGIDWGLLGLGPDHSGLLRLLPPSSTAELSDDDGLDSGFTEVSSAPPVALSGSGISADESSEHSFIRPTATPSSVTLPAADSSSAGGCGGLFDDESPSASRPKRRPLRQYASEPKTTPTASKLLVSRRLGRPSVSLKKRSQPSAVTPKSRSGHKKARPLPASSADVSPPAKKLRSPPTPTITDGCIDDDMGGESAAEASHEETKSGTGVSQPVFADVPTPSSVVEVLDLTSDDVVTSLPGKVSSPFSSPVMSFFPRKDGRPRRSTSVASELRMRESLEKELADDDFMLGLTAEGSVAGTMDLAPS